MDTLCYLVETEKIAHNIRLLRKRAGERVIYAVVKADGYGLGCREMTAILSKNGLRRFAVTTLADAEAVLAAGEEVEELLLLSSPLPTQIPRLAALDVTFTVASVQDAEKLAGYDVRAHIKVDTGFGRRGFDARQTALIAGLYQTYPGITFSGIYTHFADGGDTKATRGQFAKFQGVLQELQKAGIEPGIRHCCSSESLFSGVDMLLDGVRVGSALLGRVVNCEKFGLQRTGICQVPIEAVRTLPKGATVGYGSVFRARRDMQVAICPIGIHHGFGLAVRCGVQKPQASFFDLLRRLRSYITGRAFPYARIQGKRCNVLGCICSEMVVLDVSNVRCSAGDVAFFDVNPMLLHDVKIEFV